MPKRPASSTPGVCGKTVDAASALLGLKSTPSEESPQGPTRDGSMLPPAEESPSDSQGSTQGEDDDLPIALATVACVAVAAVPPAAAAPATSASPHLQRAASTAAPGARPAGWHSERVASNHARWQATIRAALEIASPYTQALVAPLTQLDPLGTAFFLRRLAPHELTKLDAPVKALVDDFQERAELSLWSNPALKAILDQAFGALDAPTEKSVVLLATAA